MNIKEVINGIKEGKGIMLDSNIDIYDEKGLFNDSLGNEYNGEWKNDKKYGKGKIKLNNGDELDGDWVNNIFVNGKIRYFNGDLYEGDISNNKKHGFDKMIYSNGDEFNGKQVNNSKEGEGIIKLKKLQYN